MEALSVAGSIVGLVAAGAQLVPMFYNLASAIKDAPDHALAAVREVASITVALEQLHNYLYGPRQAPTGRLSLIHMEHVTATLTECVMTYSELNVILKSLHVDKRLNAWDRVMWLLRRDDIDRLLRRVQNHKSTFVLMLQIIQCSTQAEAEQNMEDLRAVVSEVLLSNQALASRLRNIEHMMSSSVSTRTVGTVGTAQDHLQQMSEQPPETPDSYGPEPMESPSIRLNEVSTSIDWPFSSHPSQLQRCAFEEQLFQTRVYRHAADRHSLYSVPSDGRTTLAISLSSSVTLREVSKIAVYALPIFVAKLSNAHCYDLLPQDLHYRRQVMLDVKWLFILQGAVTFVVAVAAAFILPDDPLKTKWLTHEERKLANSRFNADTVGAKSETSTLRGLLDAAKDPKLWLFTFMQHMHLAANGFKNFFPTAVETLGFDTTITLVLTCPPYLIAGIVSIMWNISLGRFNERTWHITIAKTVAVTGFILACATLNTGVRYFAMVVFAIGTYAVNSIILGWVSATCGANKERKACSLAIMKTIANISFIWTPYLWPASDEPCYTIAMSSSAGFSIATATGAWLMKIWLMKLNKKIRQSDDETVLRYAY